MPQRIYLDNNATTRIDPRVLEAIVSHLKDHFGNPSSHHSFGQDNRNRLLKARNTVASYFDVKANEIIFTSSGTEGANMVLRGLFEGQPQGHMITSTVEHSCVFGTAKLMQAGGTKVTYLSPGLWGAIKPDAVRAALQPDTRLIALMAVNNETGVKTDIEGIAQIALERKIPFFVDGVALLGKEPFTIPAGVSAMCFSGHKLHAPIGCGLAFIRSNLKLRPLLTGGDHEYSRRAGTENVAGIIGLAEAIKLLRSELPEAMPRVARLRDKLEQTLMSRLPNVTVNGQGPRVVNTSNLCFEGVDGESLLTALDMEGVAVSHASACASGALEPSRVLLNMGISPEMAASSIRISLSRFTTEEEIDRCIGILVHIVERLRHTVAK